MFPEGGSTAWDHGTPAYPTHAPQPAIPRPAACSLVTAPGSKACASIRCAFAPSARPRFVGVSSKALRGVPFTEAKRGGCTRAGLARATTGTGLARATSDSGMSSPLPHLHLDGAHPCHICAGTGLTPSFHMCSGTAQSGSTPSTTWTCTSSVAAVGLHMATWHVPHKCRPDVNTQRHVNMPTHPPAHPHARTHHPRAHPTSTSSTCTHMRASFTSLRPGRRRRPQLRCIASRHLMSPSGFLAAASRGGTAE
jgi:hypothetical protein